MDATSLPVELEPGPPSEKLTWKKKIIITFVTIKEELHSKKKKNAKINIQACS